MGRMDLMSTQLKKKKKRWKKVDVMGVAADIKVCRENYIIQIKN